MPLQTSDDNFSLASSWDMIWWFICICSGGVMHRRQVETKQVWHHNDSGILWARQLSVCFVHDEKKKSFNVLKFSDKTLGINNNYEKISENKNSSINSYWANFDYLILLYFFHNKYFLINPHLESMFLRSCFHIFVHLIFKFFFKINPNFMTYIVFMDSHSSSATWKWWKIVTFCWI